MNFSQLGVSAPILKALDEASYTNPTPVQVGAIPSALQGQDILGLAQTGTGKTAAFAIPILQQLKTIKVGQSKRVIQSLILTPTRELAIQIQESFKVYGRFMPLRSTVVFGGVTQGHQVRALQQGVDILIATPGRLMDLVQQRHIDLSNIKIFTLDEADRMLDMGFIHDIKKILTMLPLKKQTMLFSATMPKEIHEIVNKLLVNPVNISITPVSSTVDTVKQYVTFVDTNHKMDVLEDFIKENKNESVLVFTKTKHGADKVVKELLKRNITARAIHGNKSQNARQGALQEFKSLQTQVLVATDIASRGIDIHDLNYVVNYDLPDVSETYVHRIGRTGRAGNSGVSLTLCNHQDKELLVDIEKLIKKKITVLANDKYPMIDFTPKPKAKGSQTKKTQTVAKPTRIKVTSEQAPSKSTRNTQSVTKTSRFSKSEQTPTKSTRNTQPVTKTSRFSKSEQVPTKSNRNTKSAVQSVTKGTRFSKSEQVPSKNTRSSKPFVAKKTESSNKPRRNYSGPSRAHS